MKRKKWKVRNENKRKGKEGFPIEDRKKVKRKKMEENKIVPDQ